MEKKKGFFWGEKKNFGPLLGGEKKKKNFQPL